ncbi:hypothetical protein H5203_21295 [Pseudoalteromonas sp. SG41-1]|uniref:hypothetical protein n=1 Tax=Pseudoalteromonas sp. SG41-1 TaxID=2760979 RepID=UPI00160299C0|nr:hypothetical protein [Pseudoalteromonas sp. SG41-1]MBB1507982.1 hypothetical protein [Pseudoalteromonas sp. SG41-1]
MIKLLLRTKIKTMGRFIGKGKYVYSQQEKKDYQQMMVSKWKEKYITITSLKNDRLWTTKMIDDFLGKPLRNNGYKYFLLEKVLKVEAKEVVKKKLNTRLMKRLKRNHEYYLESGLELYKEDHLKYIKAMIENF